MTNISWLLFLCLAGGIPDIVSNAYEQIGTVDPWSVELQLEQSRHQLPDATNLVVLLHEPVQTDGEVFAFNARIHEAKQFHFQVWRPVDASGGGVDNSEFRLVADRLFTPSVDEKRQHEDFYLFGEQCIRVKRSDRLGLFFESIIPPIYYGSANFNYKVIAAPTVGDQLTFSRDLPVNFVATGFVYVNGSSSPASGNDTAMTCTKGLRIVQSGVIQAPSSTTTYQPPIGVPGAIGDTGPTGPRGEIGSTGINGSQGEQGQKGGVGATGRRGPIGISGENNTYTGQVGVEGVNGSQGEEGYTGSQGPQGRVGVQGLVGPAGNNHTAILYGPYRYSRLSDTNEGAEWWTSSKAMEAVYIWLAANSLVVLVTFIIILISCCQYCAARRALEKKTDV